MLNKMLVILTVLEMASRVEDLPKNICKDMRNTDRHC